MELALDPHSFHNHAKLNAVGLSIDADLLLREATALLRLEIELIKHVFRGEETVFIIKKILTACIHAQVSSICKMMINEFLSAIASLANTRFQVNLLLSTFW